jgi:hypothetical protein
MAVQYAAEASAQAAEIGMRRVGAQASTLLASLTREGSTT